MDDPEAFIDRYLQYARDVLEPTRQDVEKLFMEWKSVPGYWSKYRTHERLPDPSPVQRVVARVKELESVQAKIHRKPDAFPDGLTDDSVRRMHDTVGARVVVYFLSDLTIVDREIRIHDGLEVSADDPPVAYLPDSV